MGVLFWLRIMLLILVILSAIEWRVSRVEETRKTLSVRGKNPDSFVNRSTKLTE